MGQIAAREDDVLKLLDVVQDLFAHALTLQTMYQRNLEPEEYEPLRAKSDIVAKQNCALLRNSIEGPETFAAAVRQFVRIDPRHRLE
jgi:hypothetical protein